MEAKTLMKQQSCLEVCSHSLELRSGSVTSRHEAFIIMQTGRLRGKWEQGGKRKKGRVRQCSSSLAAQVRRFNSCNAQGEEYHKRVKMSDGKSCFIRLDVGFIMQLL